MIREAEVRDVDRIYQIASVSFFDPISKKDVIDEMLHNKTRHIFVYEEYGQVLAYYSVNMIIDQAELFSIAVDPAFRGRKIGDCLLEHLLNFCSKNGAKEIFLEVSTKNTPAICLYKKYGFWENRLRENYYQKTMEDAYEMKRGLK